MLYLLGLFSMKQFVFEKPHKTLISYLSVLYRTKLQDPLVLFEPQSLKMVLQEWLSQLEKTFAMKDFSGISDTGNSSMESNQGMLLLDESKKGILDEEDEKEKRDSLGNEETVDRSINIIVFKKEIMH